MARDGGGAPPAAPNHPAPAGSGTPRDPTQAVATARVLVRHWKLFMLILDAALEVPDAGGPQPGPQDCPAEWDELCRHRLAGRTTGGPT